MLGLFNLGGGEIVLILALLAMLLVVPAVLIGVIFLIIRMSRKGGLLRVNCCASSNPERQFLAAKKEKAIDGSSLRAPKPKNGYSNKKIIRAQVYDK
jgi:hypothetical protein